MKIQARHLFLISLVLAVVYTASAKRKSKNNDVLNMDQTHVDPESAAVEAPEDPQKKTTTPKPKTTTPKAKTTTPKAKTTKKTTTKKPPLSVNTTTTRVVKTTKVTTTVAPKNTTTPAKKTTKVTTTVAPKNTTTPAKKTTTRKPQTTTPNGFEQKYVNISALVACVVFSIRWLF